MICYIFNKNILADLDLKKNRYDLVTKKTMTFVLCVYIYRHMYNVYLLQVLMCSN
jgi:hypothetical protein